MKFSKDVFFYYFAKLDHQACCCLSLLFECVFSIPLSLPSFKFSDLPSNKTVPKSIAGGPEQPVKQQNISFFFFSSTPRHMEVTGPRVGLELQLKHVKHVIRVASATYAAVCSKARSLTHWPRTGMESASSQRQVGWVLTYWATTGTPPKNVLPLKRNINKSSRFADLMN